MILYLDQLVASNLIVNYLIIKTINLVFKDKTNVLMLVLGLFLSVLSLALFFIPYNFLHSVRYLFGVIIGFVVFYKDNFKEKIVKISIFYLINIAFIGTLVIFNVRTTILLYASLLVVLILWIIENYKNFVIQEKRLTYDVIIGTKHFKGFLDTGNQTYADGIPVVFIKMKYYSQNYQYHKTIKVCGVGNQNVLDIYTGPLLIMDNRQYVVYYAFVDKITKEIILNGEMGEMK